VLTYVTLRASYDSPVRDNAVVSYGVLARVIGQLGEDVQISRCRLRSACFGRGGRISTGGPFVPNYRQCWAGRSVLSQLDRLMLVGTDSGNAGSLLYFSAVWIGYGRQS
jgi:hypothetical protein